MKNRFWDYVTGGCILATCLLWGCTAFSQPSSTLIQLGVDGVTDQGGPGFENYLIKTDPNTGFIPISVLGGSGLEGLLKLENVVYVDPDVGSDINTYGAITTPYATLEYAVANELAGTTGVGDPITFVLAPGTHTLSSSIELGAGGNTLPVVSLIGMDPLNTFINGGQAIEMPGTVISTFTLNLYGVQIDNTQINQNSLPAGSITLTLGLFNHAKLLPATTLGVDLSKTLVRHDSTSIDAPMIPDPSPAGVTFEYLSNADYTGYAASSPSDWTNKEDGSGSPLTEPTEVKKALDSLASLPTVYRGTVTDQLLVWDEGNLRWDNTTTLLSDLATDAEVDGSYVQIGSANFDLDTDLETVNNLNNYAEINSVGFVAVFDNNSDLKTVNNLDNYAEIANATFDNASDLETVNNLDNYAEINSVGFVAIFDNNSDLKTINNLDNYASKGAQFEAEGDIHFPNSAGALFSGPANNNLINVNNLVNYASLGTQFETEGDNYFANRNGATFSDVSTELTKVNNLANYTLTSGLETELDPTFATDAQLASAITDLTDGTTGSGVLIDETELSGALSVYTTTTDLNNNFYDKTESNNRFVQLGTATPDVATFSDTSKHLIKVDNLENYTLTSELETGGDAFFANREGATFSDTSTDLIKVNNLANYYSVSQANAQFRTQAQIENLSSLNNYTTTASLNTQFGAKVNKVGDSMNGVLAFIDAGITFTDVASAESTLLDITTAVGNNYLTRDGFQIWDSAYFSPTDYDASQSELDAHITDSLNPHNVTKTQVGLSDVDNTSDANKPISTATQNALDLKQDASTAATDAELNAHVIDTANPHSVTKTQVGLSNVDNTSDANKPISTATQNALDDKLNLTGGTVTGVITMSGGGSDLRMGNQSIQNAQQVVSTRFIIKENIVYDETDNGQTINSDYDHVVYETAGIPGGPISLTGNWSATVGRKIVIDVVGIGGQNFILDISGSGQIFYPNAGAGQTITFSADGGFVYLFVAEASRILILTNEGGTVN